MSYIAISAGKFRRYGRGFAKEATDVRTISKNLSDSVRVLKGISQARKILTRFKPDVVFCKGGYVTVPVGIAAKQKKIPLVIHESDTVFGVANKILASRANKIAVGFKKEFYYNSKCINKIIYTGNPVRKQLYSLSEAAALKQLGIKTKLPILLVFGGSQGAEAINEAVFKAVGNLCKHYILIHQTGKAQIELARVKKYQLTKSYQKNYLPFDFLNSEMAAALASAKLIVGRASAGTISEIAANKKPAILIPNPNATANHQNLNAKVLLKSGAVRVIDESELTDLKLVSQIDRLLADKSALKYLQSNITEFFNPNASRDIAQIIVRNSGRLNQK